MVTPEQAIKAIAALEKKYATLKNDRSHFENYWRELSIFFLPPKQYVNSILIAGKNVETKLYDNIGVRSADKLASQLHGLLMNPATIWFLLRSGRSELDNDKKNAEWLNEVARIMIGIFNNSNFHTEIQECLLDLCVFGTGAIRIEEDDKDVVRFESRPVYEAVVSEDARGRVNGFCYTYTLTLDQIVTEYGLDALPKDCADKYLVSPNEKYTVLHYCVPSDQLPEEIRDLGKPYTSLHVLMEKKHILRLGGYNTFPAAFPRFSKLSGEIYGRSPAMRCLSDVKVAHQMKKLHLDSAHLQIRPPLVVADDGVLMPIRTTPSAINIKRAGMKDAIEKLDIGGNILISEKTIEQLHADIRSTFYLDQFQLVENDRMTTVEVNVRRDEQLRAFSPLTSRMNTELLPIIVERTFDICYHRGLLPPMPMGLSKSRLEPRYVSQLSRAQETVDVDNFVRSFQLLQGVAGVNPQVIDYLDADKIAKFVFRTYGAPLDLLFNDNDVKRTREQRAASEAQRNQLENSKLASETAKNLSAGGLGREGL